MRRPILRLLVPLLLASCASRPEPARDAAGRWTGTLVADEGECPTDRISTLEIRGHDLLFTPGDGSLVLHGTYRPRSEHYHAELLGADMNGKPTAFVFNGYPVGANIGGTFGSAACRAHVTLRRV